MYTFLSVKERLHPPVQILWFEQFYTHMNIYVFKFQSLGV
jgi:hypothetical protein